MIFRYLLILTMLLPFRAFALIEVDITRGNLNPIPVAVSPLSIDSVSKKSLEKAKDALKPFYLNINTVFFLDTEKEYCEAMLVYSFLSESNIPTPEDLQVTTSSYLKGLADFIEMITDDSPNKKSYWARQKIGSFVPNIWTKFVNDPFYRDVKSLLEKLI